MANSTKSARRGKAKHGYEKPYADFPLTPHPSGRWCKKIKGKLHYFGSIDKPEAALEKLHRELPYLADGRTPPLVGDGSGCTIAELCNAFLTSKTRKFEAGEISARTICDYRAVCDRVVGHFGRERRVDDLRPDDFEKYRSLLAKHRGPVALKDQVNRVRIVLKYAHDQGLIDRPVNYGQSFDRPSAKMIRRARNTSGTKMFEAAELRMILDALDGQEITLATIDEETGEPQTFQREADPIMKAMVLLAANGGFGNTDVSDLPRSAVDLAAGWIDFPRPKTEIERRSPLWPETIDAMRQAMDCRPTPAERRDRGLCFVTRSGNPWVRVQAVRPKGETADARQDQRRRTVPIDALSQKFARLLKRLEINGSRGFYAIRHTFETIGGESRDQVAVNAIMGHVDSSMAGVYRERISDERLRAVVDVVRGWLFAE